jgi:hypothetical protein
MSRTSRKPKTEGWCWLRRVFWGTGCFRPRLPFKVLSPTRYRRPSWGWGQSLQRLVGELPAQGLRAPVCGTHQAPVMLVGQVCRSMPSQRLQIGPFAVDDVEHAQPAEDQLVPVVNARPQHPQALRHLGGADRSKTWSRPPGGYAIRWAFVLKYPWEYLDCKGFLAFPVSKPVIFEYIGNAGFMIS